MPDIGYEDKDFWDRLYTAEEEQEEKGLTEDSWVEGEDGERLFDQLVLEAAQGKDVVDVGCGQGEFTLEIARVARLVVGIDFAPRAIAGALRRMKGKESPNVEFRRAEANSIPYPDESFDLAVSRRGPATDSLESRNEAFRVLRRGGRLLETTIGERNMLNWGQVFGRGQIDPRVKVSEAKRKLLLAAGFRRVDVEEFEAPEYFHAIKDVIMRLENSPILPDYDPQADAGRLREIERRFRTRKGIETNSHRVIIKATK